jgi:hypothetical protein
MGRISLEAFRRDLSTRPENPSSAMTVGHTRAPSRGVFRPGFANRFAQRKEGAGNAGCLLHPRSRAQSAREVRTRAYRYSRSIPAFPAQWFYGLCRALPGDEFLLPPSSANWRRSRARSGSQRLRRLDASHGRQDHTVLPYAARLRQRPRRVWYPSAEALAKADSPPFVCRAPIAHGPKPALPSASRNRRCRVHRIPSPTSVTIAIRPSWWAGTRRL